MRLSRVAAAYRTARSCGCSPATRAALRPPSTSRLDYSSVPGVRSRRRRNIRRRGRARRWTKDEMTGARFIGPGPTSSLRGRCHPQTHRAVSRQCGDRRRRTERRPRRLRRRRAGLGRRRPRARRRGPAPPRPPCTSATATASRRTTSGKRRSAPSGGSTSSRSRCCSSRRSTSCRSSASIPTCRSTVWNSSDIVRAELVGGQVPTGRWSVGSRASLQLLGRLAERPGGPADVR